MRKNLVHFVAVVLLVAPGMTAAEKRAVAGETTPAKDAPAKDGQLYTCGMHPRVIQDKPGNCPLCGMKLTPIRKQASGQTNAGQESVIVIDPAITQNMGFRSDVVKRGSLSKTIRTVGVVEFDETTLADVTTKYKGWIEKLHLNATGQPVHRGQALFEIYAPELYSAQAEYLLALSQATNAPPQEAGALRASARQKLELLDLPEREIAELEKAQKPRRTVVIQSRWEGVVVEKMVVEGQMIDMGMRLYRIADLSHVWVHAQIYEQDLPFVGLGQEAVVTLSYLPGRQFQGRITYLYPTVDEKTRTAKARLEFHNPDLSLKPGMFATVALRAELEPSALLVPDSAVLRGGVKDFVFVVRDAGHFEPRQVTLGPRADGDCYQVLTGLNEGERVVTSGQFMLDSESQLREAIQKMTQPGTATAPSGPAAESGIPPVESHAAPAQDASVATLYTCPMAEHAHVVSDKPGECPECEMRLIETSKVKHGREAEENWRKKHPAGHAPSCGAPAPRQQGR